ncbi:hypothetical protein JCM17846_14530 [Iodidimonas nitroreducens]|uniref:Ribbon-helix-helix protein CopG domain-containing protein n=1 Tax=Iodidimonas nitroreducens TaxID=1236968 RepID=A0A5A7N645_9PROT|nr:hypothetical protein [Iodidimonas nitroreducens]GAK34126.1 hypothetical protein AQ1_02022 [alpha proteobacterium Q-1]GER03771.1 hypothetical protein JCM17846_14530 [Iodidimonas nitroreducens]
METKRREKFATQVNPEILSAIRDLAQDEGRQLQALVDEALADLIEKRRQGRPRAHVMAAYQASHDRYAPLYKKLAE